VLPASIKAVTLPAASTHSVFLLAAMPGRAHGGKLVKTASFNTDAD
jgi:hypothetical protein